MGSLAQAATGLDWDAIYADNLPRVFRFFCYRVGDTAVAEDLTSTTFEKAWRNRDRYRRDEAGFQAWLFTIARNVANDHFRRVPLSDSIDAAADLPSPELTDAEFDRREQFRRLAALLLSLSPPERDLIALKYGTEMSNREIGRLLGLSESNVGTVLSRLVARLRARWDGARAPGGVTR
ncbi:MAG: sigma-70 family RNA polymerase sigma factor [Thermoflexales bacterium]|nr:sigma-70 family RNA polymerase sigma factor [Thermoflexales bacterium]